MDWELIKCAILLLEGNRARYRELQDLSWWHSRCRHCRSFNWNGPRTTTTTIASPWPASVCGVSILQKVGLVPVWFVQSGIFYFLVLVSNPRNGTWPSRPATCQNLVALFEISVTKAIGVSKTVLAKQITAPPDILRYVLDYHSFNFFLPLFSSLTQCVWITLLYSLLLLFSLLITIALANSVGQVASSSSP